MKPTAKSDCYEITEAQDKRMRRQSELQLAISNAILVQDKMLDPALGNLTIEDIVFVLSRLINLWAERIWKKGK